MRAGCLSLLNRVARFDRMHAVLGCKVDETSRCQNEINQIQRKHYKCNRWYSNHSESSSYSRMGVEEDGVREVMKVRS